MSRETRIREIAETMHETLATLTTEKDPAPMKSVEWIEAVHKQIKDPEFERILGFNEFDFDRYLKMLRDNAELVRMALAAYLLKFEVEKKVAHIKKAKWN